jgi:hypothetical protein
MTCFQVSRHWRSGYQPRLAWLAEPAADAAQDNTHDAAE